MVFICSMYKN